MRSRVVCSVGKTIDIDIWIDIVVLVCFCKVANEKEHYDRERDTRCAKKEPCQEVVLPSKAAQFCELDVLFVSNRFCIKLIQYLHLVCQASSHDSIHTPIQLLEVSERFHLIPDHEMLVFNICPVSTFVILILIGNKLFISIDLMSDVCIVDSHIKWPINRANPLKNVLKVVFSNRATWVCNLGKHGIRFETFVKWINVSPVAFLKLAICLILNTFLIVFISSELCEGVELEWSRIWVKIV